MRIPNQLLARYCNIYTNGNSYYSEAFAEDGMRMNLRQNSIGTIAGHMVESFKKSTIRDNLARFNRKNKRYSKNIDILNDTLLLFFNKNKIINIKEQSHFSEV